MMFNNLKNKKILITGHTGFKGSWLCKLLYKYGANLYGYSLLPEKEQSLYSYLNIRSLLNGECINDILNRETLKSFIDHIKPDIVFHLAAQPLVRKSYQFPKYTFEVNANGTLNILECFRNYDKKCSIICITTDKVYENNELGIPFIESDKLGGYDPYSASKAAAEIIISSYRNSFFNPKLYGKNHKIQLASVRAGNVIGGGDFSDDRIIVDIVKSIASNQTIQIRNPNSIRPWQHVLDPLHGYLKLADLMELKFNEEYSSSFNFGPNSNSFQTVKYLVEKAMLEFKDGSWKDVSKEGELHESNILKLNIDKAKKVLNWEPKLDIDESLHNTFDWYKCWMTNGDLEQLTNKQINEYDE